VVTDPNFANVVLLAHNNGSNNGTTFTDNSPSPKTLTTISPAKTVTGTKKFGSASAEFDGSSAGVDVGANEDSVGWGSGAFTIEAWLRRNSASDMAWFTSEFNGTGVVIRCASQVATGNLYVLTRGPGGANLTVIAGTGNPSGAIPGGSFAHCCVMRASGVIYVFQDGVLQASGAVTDNFTAGLRTSYGYNRRSSSQYWNGWIDDLRVTIGTARYSTSGFTPPAAEFPDS
jgi:hypothetical protein